MTTTSDSAAHASPATAHQPHCWRRWVFATNHKDIGTMNLVFSCTMWFIGGSIAMLFPLHFLGLAGMPRRIPDFPTQFSDWNMISSIGGFVYGVAQILFAYVIWKCVRTGRRADDRVWDGARGLERELQCAEESSRPRPKRTTICATGVGDGVSRAPLRINVVLNNTVAMLSSRNPSQIDLVRGLDSRLPEQDPVTIVRSGPTCVVHCR